VQEVKKYIALQYVFDQTGMHIFFGFSALPTTMTTQGTSLFVRTFTPKPGFYFYIFDVIPYGDSSNLKPVIGVLCAAEVVLSFESVDEILQLATELYVHVVLLIMLYKVVIILESVGENLRFDHFK